MSGYTRLDIDMDEASYFSISRLQEIIYGAKLQGQEAKMLARFMHDVKLSHEHHIATSGDGDGK